MIKLKWLKMRAFRSFAEEVRIDFPASGLVLIRGSNQTNHDSSGTGKSTILLAIGYALDMCPFPASELQSWYADTDMQVQVGFDSPQGEVVINRGKRNSLKIGDAEPVTGAKAIAEGIKKLFGLDAETLSAITYRPQNTNGLFLSLTDGEKKDFLTKILGLDNIEKAVDQAETQVKLLTPAVEAEDFAIAEIEANLTNLRSQIIPDKQDYGELTMEVGSLQAQLRLIDRQKTEVWSRAEAQKATADQDPEITRLKQYLEAALAQRTAAINTNTELNREFQARQAGLRSKVQEITRQEMTQAQIVRQIADLEQQRLKTLQGQCPTCARTWDEAAKKAEEAAAGILNLQARLKTLGDFTNERRKVEEGLREVFVMDPVIEQLKFMAEQIQSQLQARIVNLIQGPVAEAQEQTNILNLQKSVAATRLQGLQEQIRTIESMNAKLDQVRSYAATSVATLQGRLDGRQKVVAKFRAELNAEKDFLALMGREGFLGVIFDDVLREIEDEANARLGRLANVSHVTIQFKSEVETQKGTIKKSITPVVSVNGVEAKLKSGLSGGMYTSVEGVVDLAVMAVVQRRTGALPGFLFLDESFNGQGTATKEAAMEVLREYGQEKLVVVIDHNSEFKEMFTQFIDVSFKDGKSGIV